MKRKSKLLSFILLVLSLILLAGCAKNAAKPADVGRATVTKVEDAAAQPAQKEKTKTDLVKDEKEESAKVGADAADIKNEDADETVQDVADEEPEEAAAPEEPESRIDEDGYYYDLESVVLYLDEFGRLPKNFITKKEAEKLGWEGGPVSDYYDGGAIGGSHFGNYEKLLPDGDYKECDIDTNGTKGRGAKRLVFSSDGKYYYTDDHYESFHEVIIKDGTVEVLK